MLLTYTYIYSLGEWLGVMMSNSDVDALCACIVPCVMAAYSIWPNIHHVASMRGGASDAYSILLMCLHADLQQVHVFVPDCILLSLPDAPLHTRSRNDNYSTDNSPRPPSRASLACKLFKLP